ncbi:hypothetical protein KPH14_011891 [Odynerus spinipes]|uniref:Tesmin/TSO1-like CXC domain-containing protein n=1 Tax=Odynerus spinipes TaxID=1348599 RepID=A0AAD9VI87_9HYME|nr:hypothetical protein KPH14_011891 [Odynerus spinipes]
MPRTKRTASKQISVAIQTDNIDSNDEIVQLQEQVKMLQLENDTLKKHVDGNTLSVKIFSDKAKLELMQSPRRVREVAKDSTILKSATKQKTCTCKGNCSNKICGCVKNKRKCGPMCKCDDEVCQNQELENKENMGDTQNEIVHEAKKLENVLLKDKSEKRKLFSPQDIENEVSLSNIQYEDICFDTPKKLSYTSDEELESKDMVEVKNDVFKRRNMNKKKHESIHDKAHATTSKKEIIKIKVKKISANENQKNKAQEPKEIESKVDSPLSEEDDKKSIPEADTSFDPMKPKRQLPRTPPHGNTEYESPNVSPNVETPTEKMEHKMDIIPEELNQENVDLDKLSIELVSCNRCKRKFYPWRIEVHQGACLGL